MEWLGRTSAASARDNIAPSMNLDAAYRRRAGAAVLGLLFVAGFLSVHLPWLRAGLWRDEAVSVYVGSAPALSSYFGRYAQMDYSPPFFDGLVGIFGRAFGWGPAPLAVLAAMCALFAMAAIAWAAFEIAGRWAAVFAALLAASSDILFWELDQVRPYAFSAGCAALVVALLARRWRRRSLPGGRSADFVFGAACLFLAFSHYAGSLAVGVLGLSALAGLALGRDRAFWRTTLIACAVSGALLVPWVPAMLEQMRVGLPWNEHATLAGKIENAAALASNLAPRWGSHGSSWSLAPFLLAALAGAAAARRTGRELARTGFALLLAFTWAIAVLVVFGVAWGVSRYLSIAAAMTAVVLACLLVAIGRSLRDSGAPRWAVAAGGILLAAGPVLGEAYRYAGSGIGRRPPARSGAPAILRNLPAKPSDLFLVAPSYLAPTLWYYGVRGEQLHGFPQWERPEEIDYARFAEAFGSPDAVPNCLARVDRLFSGGRFDRLILLTDRNPDPVLRRQVREIVDHLSAVDDRVAEGTFHGYPETIEAIVLERRRADRKTSGQN